jgi:hypothetical protein
MARAAGDMGPTFDGEASLTNLDPFRMGSHLER